MFVKEIMSRCVVECTEDMRLEEVFELLKKCEHGLVVVLDSYAHRVPIGIVSERSICEQIIARGRNPRNLYAGVVIDSNIKTVREDDLIESIDLDETKSAAAIVVTNENRQVAGILTLDKLRAARSVTQTSAAAGVKELSPVTSVRAVSTVTPVREIPAFGWVQ
jgi:predicted transcriptional regulator